MLFRSAGFDKQAWLGRPLDERLTVDEKSVTVPVTDRTTTSAARTLPVVVEGRGVFLGKALARLKPAQDASMDSVVALAGASF